MSSTNWQGLQPPVTLRMYTASVYRMIAWYLLVSRLTERQATSHISIKHTLIIRVMHWPLPAVLRIVPDLVTVCAPEKRDGCMAQPVLTGVIRVVI